MNGIIYKYTSPSGKVYIGQTLDEARRRSEFLDLDVRYAGKRIDLARQKYGPENFKYEILEAKEYENLSDALQDLNLLESYYIGKYDSYKNGYNMTYGGEGVRGIVFSEETRNKISNTLKQYYSDKSNPFKGRMHTQETKDKLSKIAKERSYSPFKGKHWDEENRKRLSERGKLNVGEKNAFWGKTHTIEAKRKIGMLNSKAVVQIDPKTDEILRVFNSAKEAGESFGKPRSNSEIIKVCKNYISPSGRHYKTALGYKWRYEKDIEGSTTIEMTSQDGTE